MSARRKKVLMKWKLYMWNWQECGNRTTLSPKKAYYCKKEKCFSELNQDDRIEDGETTIQAEIYNQLLSISISVSYTHLDVYKRQI